MTWTVAYARDHDAAPLDDGRPLRWPFPGTGAGVTTPEGLDFEALLARCEAEPIHAPGAIQPHGALLAIDDDGTIVAASANTGGVFGVDAALLLGATLPQILGSAQAGAVLAEDRFEVVTIEARGVTLDVVTHESAQPLLIELEPSSEVELGDHWRLYRALRGFHGSATVAQVLAGAVRTVRELTGFDRVMLYDFDDEWNGEVVAEDAAVGMDRFLGLRYPASDIPPQARALYLRNLLRLIPDATAQPVPLLTAATDPAELDLSDVALRAVSPVHLAYLANMGVRASMSVAIVIDDQLWGLIACHHLTGPLRPSLRVRNAVELVAQTTSTVLAALLASQGAGARVQLLRDVDDLRQQLQHGDHTDLAAAAADLGPGLTGLLDGDGAAVVSGSGTRLVGACPSRALIAGFVEHARSVGGPVVASDFLGQIDGAWAAEADVAAGALAARVGDGGDLWLLWFRPETARTVRWGGDPNSKEIGVDDAGRARLGPRSSFQEWVEQVRGRSAAWTDEQLEAAQLLARALADTYAARARRDSEVAATLQRTLMVERFPPIPDVDGAARYRPSSRQPIGGDWYDVYFRPDGRPIVALGDVAGHGIEAAATMAELRHTLRAYLLRERTPAAAMSRLNDLMITLMPQEMATAVLVELDPRAHTATIINAGHLPPVLVDQDGARLVDEHHDVALGVRATSYTTTHLELSPGSSLVLYSDGLIERRDRSIDDSFALLLGEAAGQAGTTADQLCDHLVGRMAVGSDSEDDITVVALHLPLAALPVAERG